MVYNLLSDHVSLVPLALQPLWKEGEVGKETHGLLVLDLFVLKRRSKYISIFYFILIESIPQISRDRDVLLSHPFFQHPVCTIYLSPRAYRIVAGHEGSPGRRASFLGIRLLHDCPVFGKFIQIGRDDAGIVPRDIIEPWREKYSISWVQYEK